MVGRKHIWREKITLKKLKKEREWTGGGGGNVICSSEMYVRIYASAASFVALRDLELALLSACRLVEFAHANR